MTPVPANIGYDLGLSQRLAANASGNPRGRRRTSPIERTIRYFEGGPESPDDRRRGLARGGRGRFAGICVERPRLVVPAVPYRQRVARLGGLAAAAPAFGGVARVGVRVDQAHAPGLRFVRRPERAVRHPVPGRLVVAPEGERDVRLRGR